MLSSEFSTIILLGISLATITEAAPTPLSVPDWLQPIIPQKGSGPQDEIKCYSLPYGAIGFISHILTYWVILCLGFGRRPYWPFKRLSAGKTDMILSLLQLVISIGITAFTIDRCRLRWQFMLIAIWKLVMSVEVGIFGLRASYQAMKNKKYNLLGGDHIWSWADWTPYTLILYAMGVIVGMVGLMSVVWQNRHNLQIIQITAVFGSVTLFIIIVCSLVFCCNMCTIHYRSLSKPLVAVFFTGVLVCSLYSDWILGVIAGGLIGVPSGDNSVLYWTYFAAKRLPLLMT